MTAEEENPIVKKYGPRSTSTSLTLYERMGGEAKLETIVDGVYKLMRDDKVIGKQFARFRLDRLKDLTVDYLRGEFGGKEYNGSDLWISHSHLAVKNDWYDIMMKYYVKMLKKAKIPKQESEEILESLEKMRKPIVDPGQKLKEIYLRHCQAEDSKVGGDGWTVGTRGKKVEQEEEEDKPKDVGSAAKPKSQPSKAAPRPDASPRPPGDAAPPASRAASPKRRPAGQKPAAPAPGQFCFSPAGDAPPAPIPSSAPSGAELLYRLSNWKMASRSVDAGAAPTPAMGSIVGH